MRYIYSLISILAFCPISLVGQTQECNIEELNRLKIEYQKLSKAKESRIIEYLNKNSLTRKSFLLGANEMSLIDVRHGVPIYYTTWNHGSVRSVGALELRPEGSLGLNITGELTNIGIWDRALPLSSHQEFEGRMINSDAATEFSFHSTHVSGTILAGGINPNAKGFCYKGKAKSFDWFQDTEEMIEELLNNNLMVSNHSYGIPGGWNGNTWLGDLSISDKEDYRFGYYDIEAKAFDDIAYNAPYYSIVVAAGNERGDFGDGSIPADGPYDCISGFSTGKNVFTVGAVKKLTSGYTGPEDIEMSSFSSWGPVDDGRIKPDFCAPGVDLLSSTNESEQSYGISSGTSMASPSVAGVVSLINETYQLFTNSFLKSASLKALLIHTIHEAGENPGPDYQFGWGMVSADKAAQFIQNLDNRNNILIETTLENNEQFELAINPRPGEKVTVTLAWTDPSGTVPPRSLDPTNLMLVNDLDLSIEDINGVVAEPWVLDPLTPTAPATHGNNSRDNVEKIEFDSPEAKPYFIKVKHKSILKNEAQDFSLIVSYTSEEEGITNIYWVNGNGSWQDQNQWSLSSGGSSSGLTPDINNKVIIDDNSGLGSQLNITLDSDIQSAGLVAFTNKDLVIDLNGHTISLSGTTIVSSANYTIRNGTLVFSSSNTDITQTLSLSETNLEDIKIVFDSNNLSNWNLKDNNLKLSSLIHDGGQLNIEQSEIECDSLMITSNIHVVNSTIGISSLFELLQAEIWTESGINNLLVNDVSSAEIVFGDNEVGMTISLAHSTVEINALRPISQLSVDASRVSLLNVELINHLMINAPSEINLEQGSQVICDEAEFITDGISRVVLKGIENSPASFGFLQRDRYCFDNLDIEHVNLIGNASVSVGNNSTIINGEGWFQGNCEDLLFADFDSKYLCQGAMAEFLDISKGSINAREWYINGDLVSQNSSFEYFLETEGEYNVVLKIFDDNANEQQWERSIAIEASDLEDNRITRNATQLASLKIAESYQWYVNGEKIPGATNRVYPYNGQEGIYWVVTFQGDCNRRSEILDVKTSIEELDESEIGLKIYPNPVHNSLFIEYDNPSVPLEIKVYNSLGEMMNIDIMTFAPSKKEIALTGYPSGLYLVYLRIGKDEYITKIVKSNE